MASVQIYRVSTETSNPPFRLTERPKKNVSTLNNNRFEAGHMIAEPILVNGLEKEVKPILKAQLLWIIRYDNANTIYEMLLNLVTIFNCTIETF